MKKNILFFLIITICILYVKIEYQSYIGSRIFGIVTGLDFIGHFEKSDIFISLLYFLFLPKIIYKIFRQNFKNTGKNKKIMILLILMYFYIIELIVTAEFLFNDSRIRAFFGLKKEMIPEKALLSLLSPVNFFFATAVLAIFLFTVRKSE